MQANNAPASRSPAECSDCGSSAVTLVLEEHGRDFAAEEVVTAIVEEVWAANDTVMAWADSQPTKPCCSLAGVRSAKGYWAVLHAPVFGVRRKLKDHWLLPRNHQMLHGRNSGYVGWRVWRRVGVVNRCCCKVAECRRQGQNSHHLVHKWQTSVVDYLAMVQKTCTRSMPWGHML